MGGAQLITSMGGGRGGGGRGEDERVTKKAAGASQCGHGDEDGKAMPSIGSSTSPIFGVLRVEPQLDLSPMTSFSKVALRPRLDSTMPLSFSSS
ncbi:hypothetical protein NL676_031383 [Syzygium grande]|nr:hypothetical protein NL676_031383 [Syzygium grande]